MTAVAQPSFARWQLQNVSSSLKTRRFTRDISQITGAPPQFLLTQSLCSTPFLVRYLPILSGLIIPFAILLESGSPLYSPNPNPHRNLSVPGLTSHWYIRTDGYVTVETQENPPILYAAMAISITLAVIANICEYKLSTHPNPSSLAWVSPSSTLITVDALGLIIRFLERRIYGMTVAAIVCLFVHDVINIAVVTTFGVVHRFDDGFTYSQAFWMTVCSTIASVTTTITLLLDYFLTPNFANSGSGLTRKQRSAVIVFMVLLADLAIGALIYCFLLNLECVVCTA